MLRKAPRAPACRHSWVPAVAGGVASPPALASWQERGWGRALPTPRSLPPFRASSTPPRSRSPPGPCLPPPGPARFRPKCFRHPLRRAEESPSFRMATLRRPTSPLGRRAPSSRRRPQGKVPHARTGRDPDERRPSFHLRHLGPSTPRWPPPPRRPRRPRRSFPTASPPWGDSRSRLEETPPPGGLPPPPRQHRPPPPDAPAFPVDAAPGLAALARGRAARCFGSSRPQQQQQHLRVHETPRAGHRWLLPLSPFRPRRRHPWGWAPGGGGSLREEDRSVAPIGERSTRAARPRAPT